MPNFFDKYPYTDFHELNLDWIIKTVKETVAEWAVTLTEWHNTQEEWQQLYDYVHDYFDNLDVQEEVNHKIDQMILDGTFLTLALPVINAAVSDGLPAAVSDQIGGAVADQIYGTVASQIDGAVASQIIAPVDAWLADHITQPTTPAIDTSLTITGAAADAAVTGSKITEIKTAMNEALYGQLAKVLQGDFKIAKIYSPVWTNGTIASDGTINPSVLAYSDFIKSADGNNIHILFDGTKHYVRLVTYDDGGTFENRSAFNNSGDTLIPYVNGKKYRIVVTGPTTSDGVDILLANTEFVIAETKSTTTNIYDIAAAQTQINNYIDFTASVDNGNKWYVEENTSAKKLYLKFSSTFQIRTTWLTANATWTNVRNDINDPTRFVTTPKGNDICLVLNHGEVLQYNTISREFEISTWGNPRSPYIILMAFAWDGTLAAGYILNSVIMANLNKIEFATRYDCSQADTDTIRNYSQSLAFDYPNMFKIGWATDLHGNVDLYSYAAELCKYKQLESFVFSGDLVSYTSETSQNTLQAFTLDIVRRMSLINPYALVMPMRGNHEGINNASDPDYTSEDFNGVVIRGFIPESEPKGYYYKDFEAYKIRMIMLNSAEDDYADLRGFSTDQINWFSDVLDATPSDYSVMIFTHHIIIPGITPNPLPVNAAMIVSLIETYAATGTVIGCFYGHTHHDHLDTINGITYVGLADSMQSDLAHVCIDCAAVDQDTRTVYLKRLGDYTDARTRGVETINYTY